MGISKNLLDLVGIDFEEIYENISDNINVVNNKGIFVLVGSQMLAESNIKRSEVLGKHVDELVKLGYWNRSTSKEALIQKKDVDGLIRSRSGNYLLSSSKVVLDDEGEVKYVITTSRPIFLLEKFHTELAKEKENREQYERIVTYMQEREIDNQIVFKSPKMKVLFDYCQDIAKGDGTVMITGESGTGKEVCARYIYHHSSRYKKPFVVVDCSAIQESLIESELFGYNRGAFTGADPKGRIGLLEAANGGTVFLDEIGELPLHVQPKLLRFLENGEIRRVGSEQPIKIDVRVIAATNRNLQKLVSEKKFREDLFYRLNVIPITIPPLRERKEDVLPLAELFLNRLNKKTGQSICLSNNVIQYLETNPWNGNVRELRNTVSRFFYQAGENKSFSMPEWDNTKQPTKNEKKTIPLKDAVRDFKRQYISRAIEECDGSIASAAKLLGVDRTTLYKQGYKE